MKRVLPIAFAAVTFLLLGRVWSDLKATAQQGRGAAVDTPHWCADANNDRRVDISDGVYILNFLFTGGSAPQCLADCSTATLEDVCYDLNALDPRVSALEEPRTPVSVRLSAPQLDILHSEMNNHVAVKLELDAKNSDTFGEFNTSAHEFTAKTDGLYLIHAWALWNFQYAGREEFHHLLIRIDGFDYTYNATPSLNGWANNETMGVIRLSVGQRVSFFLKHWQPNDEADVLEAYAEIARVQ